MMKDQWVMKANIVQILKEKEEILCILKIKHSHKRVVRKVLMIIKREILN